jgi:hypothetical protein
MAKTAPLPNPRTALPPAVRPRFQFSLFWLMVTVTVVAVVLGLGASLGPVFGVVWYVTYFFVRCVVPTPLVICAIFGRGHARAFAIGALVPWTLEFFRAGEQQSLLVLTLTILNSAVCGFVAVATWRLVRPTFEG